MREQTAAKGGARAVCQALKVSSMRRKRARVHERDNCSGQEPLQTPPHILRSGSRRVKIAEWQRAGWCSCGRGRRRSANVAACCSGSMYRQSPFRKPSSELW